MRVRKHLFRKAVKLLLGAACPMKGKDMSCAVTAPRPLGYVTPIARAGVRAGLAA